MKEKLNSLLVKIEQIAIEENIPDIIGCIDEISKLLGDDYEIYKLGDDWYVFYKHIRHFHTKVVEGRIWQLLFI